MKLSKKEYNRIHQAQLRNWPKTGICQDCGATGKTDWANVSGEYLDEYDDWRELCRRCHIRKDRTRCAVCKVWPKRPRTVYASTYIDSRDGLRSKFVLGKATTYCAACYKKVEYLELGEYAWYRSG